MINSIFLIVIFLSANCRDQYLDKVLSSERTSGYYLFIKIKDTSGEREIFVLNRNLHQYLIQKDPRFDSLLYYKMFIKEKIFKGEAIAMNKDGIKTISAAYVHEDDSVLAIANGRKLDFIRYFFDTGEPDIGGRLKFNIPDKKATEVLKVAFEWNYLIEQVEESYDIRAFSCTTNQ
jgi:hypothetical protein